MGKTSRKFDGQHPAERDAEHRGALQIVPIEELCQIAHQVGQAKTPTQGETIILAAQLETDDAKMFRQEPSQRTEQLKPPARPGTSTNGGPSPHSRYSAV